MRFGKTRQQKWDAKLQTLKSWHENGIRRYAWYPVRLDDESWIWFEHYQSFLEGRDYHDFLRRGTPLFVIRIKERFKNIAGDDALVAKIKG